MKKHFILYVTGGTEIAVSEAYGDPDGRDHDAKVDLRHKKFDEQLFWADLDANGDLVVGSFIGED